MQPVASQGDSVIKVKSLPYDACQLDVLQFFDGFKIRPNGVQLVIQGNNKPSGEVSLANPAVVQQLYIHNSRAWLVVTVASNHPSITCLCFLSLRQKVNVSRHIAR